jgi:hypothetical protein
MLGKSRVLGKWKTVNSWQAACNQSNRWFTNGLANLVATPSHLPVTPRKDLLLLASCEFINSAHKNRAPKRRRWRVGGRAGVV